MSKSDVEIKLSTSAFKKYMSKKTYYTVVYLIAATLMLIGCSSRKSPSLQTSFQSVSTTEPQVTSVPTQIASSVAGATIASTQNPTEMEQASLGVGTTWLRINGSSVDDDDYSQLRHPIHYSITHATSPTLQLSFQIESGLPISEAYAIMALVDFAQVPTEYEGHTQLAHIVPMRPMETREFTLTVPVPQTQGLHKVVMLAFGSTREHTLNELFRFETSSKIFSLSSIDVQVGDDPAPHWPTLDIDRARVNFEEPADGTFQSHAINRSTSWRSNWLFEPVRAGQTLTYEIHIGNDAVSARPYAVITFLDWLQVPMDAQGHTLFAGKVERDQRLIIDAAVAVPAGEPDTTGQHTHELLVVYIVYPWAKDPEFLDLPPDTNIEGFPALNLWSTNRTALVVQAH